MAEGYLFLYLLIIYSCLVCYLFDDDKLILMLSLHVALLTTCSVVDAFMARILQHSLDAFEGCATFCFEVFVLINENSYCAHGLHLLSFTSEEMHLDVLCCGTDKSKRLNCVRCYRDALPRLCQTSFLTSEMGHSCLTYWR